MRFRFAAVGTAATLTMLGLVACGDDSASSSEPTTLTVTASEPSEGKYAFDVPAEVEGGTVQLTFKNDGTDGHEFAIVRIEDGTTAEQFVAGRFRRGRCADPRLAARSTRRRRRHRTRCDERLDDQSGQGHVRLLLHVQ